jgi:hypothetical protein
MKLVALGVIFSLTIIPAVDYPHSRRNRVGKPLGSVHIPHVESVSGKSKRVGNRFNIRTIFGTKHALRSSLMKTRPERNQQQTPQWVISVPCECGRSFIGETGRLLAKPLLYHLKDGLLEKSKLANI